MLNQNDIETLSDLYILPVFDELNWFYLTDICRYVFIWTPAIELDI